MSGAAAVLPAVSPAAGSAPLSTPEGALFTFATAIAEGDVALAAACVSRDACLITPDATAVSGREAIRPILVQLVTMRLRVRADVGRMVVAGDLALGRGRWRGRSAEPRGTSYEQSWRSTVVLKRVECDWKLHIVAPWEIEHGQHDRRET